MYVCMYIPRRTETDQREQFHDEKRMPLCSAYRLLTGSSCRHLSAAIRWHRRLLFSRQHSKEENSVAVGFCSSLRRRVFHGRSFGGESKTVYAIRGK
jgi:hypothetical protein